MANSGASVGHVYCLGPAGHAICSYWQGQGLVRGRNRVQPGPRYMRHRLAVTELHVELHEAHHAGPGLEQDREGVFPRVLFLTNTETRKESLVGAASHLDADYWALFTITTLDRALEVFESPLVG